MVGNPVAPAVHDGSLGTQTLLRGGMVVDGGGGAPYVADVLLDGGTIIEVSPRVHAGEGIRSIDLEGMLLCPGFIDVHTHDDLAILQQGCSPKLQQGVTTVIVGNCGQGLAPVDDVEASRLIEGEGTVVSLMGRASALPWRSLDEYLDHLESVPLPINVAVMVGHNTLRRCVAGGDERRLSRHEMDRMRSLLHRGLERGAVGLSSGLIYDPGRSAPGAELLELASVVSEWDGVYASHIRDEADGVLEAIHELRGVHDQTGARVHASHIKAMGRANWGRMPELLEALGPATCDVYPYTAASTGLAEAMAAGSRVTPTAPDDVVIAAAQGTPQHVGATLADVQADLGATTDETVAWLLANNRQAVTVVYFVMDEADVTDAVRHERAVVGSDGVPTGPRPHPRLYGTFPRVLARYVRERGSLTLADAVRKMTSLPADLFGLGARGRIEPGYVADLVVMRPDVVDRATYETPTLAPDGIERVFVSGVEVGPHISTQPGRLIERSR